MAAWVEPIFLSSLVVSEDPRTDGPGPLLSALARAIPGRAALALASSASLSLSLRGGRGGGDDSMAVEAERRSHLQTPEEEEEEAVEVFVASVTFNRSKAQVGFVRLPTAGSIDRRQTRGY